MNVLIVSDDGPDSVGLEILRESAKSHFGQTAKIITIVTKESAAGMSMSISPVYKSLTQGPVVDIVERFPSFYVVDGTPLDCLYVGMLFPETVLGTDTFDIVLSGVNLGHNVGVDVFHSGTVAVAMIASTLFGVASMAFSQEVDPDLEGDFDLLNTREVYKVAEGSTRKMLNNHSFTPGSCLNVNFPRAEPKGYKKAVPAAYSRFLVPKMRGGANSDIEAVKEGFITVSDLELSVAPSMNY